jgi:cell wall-associated NlpC family hydrolase
MYTHRPTGTAESGDAPKTENGTTSAQDRKDNERPWERPGVDPAIFSRVVDLYVGLPYKKGGDDEKGFDCSHLVKAVYLDYSGTRLPASTRALYQLPEDVTREELVVGDLVFFSFDDITISHVGIYMGGGRFMHASESRGVIMSSLSDPDFRDAYKGARRVL